jgi:hypothetical protein
MKTNNYKQKVKLILSGLMLTMVASAQTISDFENLTLAPNSHNDGASGSGAFISGDASFQNSYNTGWGYWESGFAYSNEGDTTVSPSDYMTQIFQSKAGVGNDSSIIFAVGQQGAVVNLIPGFADAVGGIYITNTTYAYNSMALGDSFAKKFGDTASSPHSAPGVNQGFPDWFKLSIVGYTGGMATNDTVDFYLADFRFTNDSLDYIVKDWQFVDLSALGIIDSLQFILTSSDNGSFGMNTPAFFALDDLSTTIIEGINSKGNTSEVNVYPNPFKDDLLLEFNDESKRMINVFNSQGSLIYSTETNSNNIKLDLGSLNSGIYFVQTMDMDGSSVKRIVKK